ncbi:MAG: primosomal protein N' [Polaromonas sp.]|nr:primosomal protein N' [Polaromonas sp.]
MSHWLEVVVAAPAHSAIAGPLTYRSESALSPGTLVRVPFGRREVLGVVWKTLPDAGDIKPASIRDVAGVLDGLAPLSASWRKLVTFTAQYYQRSLGEVALAALPPQLRELTPEQLARRLKRPVADTSHAPSVAQLVTLTAQQLSALAEFNAESAGQQRPALLFGATGSGKTEVYLRAAAQVLEQDPQAQVLVMVPEINLTPQLQARFEERFGHLGKERVVALHSGLTPAQRLKSWLAAHAGQARLVLGTRMAVLASIPNLRLIVVDEEHDPSYKQQEGARYSARDLAIYRARLETSLSAPEKAPCSGGQPPEKSAPSASSDLRDATSAGSQICRVLLGSATPSLESWQATLVGRYQRLDMSQRIGSTGAAFQGKLPTVRRVDMNHQPKRCIIAPPLLAAIAERVARGEQSLIFLNRRGYAPVLACHDCDWKSDCPHCSAYRVFHKIDRTLRCHHCGFTERVPHACPSCGNIDIAPVGRGTERLEEHLAELLAGVTRPDGGPVRISRIDADSTRLKGALEAQLASVHEGEVDVLVGTQMIAKGHDFRHITLVAAVNPDGALFSSDFRAAAQAQQLSGHELVTPYPAVPMTIQRVANIERAQMLVESASRIALQRFLAAWQPLLFDIRRQAEFKSLVRWAIDVDPLAI